MPYTRAITQMYKTRLQFGLFPKKNTQVDRKKKHAQKKQRGALIKMKSKLRFEHFLCAYLDSKLTFW